MAEKTEKKDLTSLIDLTSNTNADTQDLTGTETVTEFASLEDSLVDIDPANLEVRPLEEAARTPDLAEPQTQAFNLEPVQAFASAIHMTEPRVEAKPAFSLHATGLFDEKKQNQIVGIITSLDLGIHPDELKIQLESGKLFVPRVSEYVTTVIAQKIRDLVDTIKIDLSSF